MARAAMPHLGQYIETSELTNLHVTTAKLANLAVTNGKIGLLAVDTAQLADNAVTTGKLAAFLANQLSITVHNASGGPLDAGTLCILSGVDGGVPVADPAEISNGLLAQVVLTETIANGATGVAAPVWLQTDFDTSGFVAGDALWLDPANAGQAVNTLPSGADTSSYYVGLCLTSAVSGQVLWCPGLGGFYGIGATNLQDGCVTHAKLTDPSVDGLHAMRVAKVTYDFATHGGGTGTIGLGVSLPDNAIVYEVLQDVVVGLTTNTAAGTIKLTLPVDGDLTAALGDTGAGTLVDGLPDGTAAAAVKTTAARELSVTIETQPVLTGQIVYFVTYFVSA